VARDLVGFDSRSNTLVRIFDAETEVVVLDWVDGPDAQSLLAWRRG